jgi:medium-chain acyl-[acyl-carrier-protein] hydrolase
MHNPAASDRWIMQPRRLPRARLRLFCLPHAGGGASLYRLWAEHLPEFIEVCPIQLPGRETRIRERPFDALEPLVRALTEAVTPWLDRPYAVFGHSAGALIGFELSRALRSAGLPEPVRLFVSGRTAPHHPCDEPATWDLPDAALIETLRELGGAREEVLAHPELMELLLPIVRADLAVAERYVFRGGDPLDSPITALAGRDDPRAPPAALEGWAEHTRGRFQLEVFPGGHFFVQTIPAAVCRLVAAELAEVADVDPPPAPPAPPASP